MLWVLGGAGWAQFGKTGNVRGKHGLSMERSEFTPVTLVELLYFCGLASTVAWEWPARRFYTGGSGPPTLGSSRKKNLLPLGPENVPPGSQSRS